MRPEERDARGGGRADDQPSLDAIAQATRPEPGSGQGFTVWFTGLSGSGKSTVAALVGEGLRRQGFKVEVLDGDVIRTHLSKGLGFSKVDRDTNIRRIGWVCEMLNRNGVLAVVAAISPYRETREEVRRGIPRFIEVYMDCPLDVLMARDSKGLYKRALSGEVPNFTGISDPYEPPLSPEAICHTDGRETPEESAATVLHVLAVQGLIPEPVPSP